MGEAVAVESLMVGKNVGTISMSQVGVAAFLSLFSGGLFLACLCCDSRVRLPSDRKSEALLGSHGSEASAC